MSKQETGTDPRCCKRFTARRRGQLAGREKRRRAKITHSDAAGNHEVRRLKMVGKEITQCTKLQVSESDEVSVALALDASCDPELLLACRYASLASIWLKWTLDVTRKKSSIRRKTLAGMTERMIDEGNIAFPPRCIILPFFVPVNSSTLALLWLML